MGWRDQGLWEKNYVYLVNRTGSMEVVTDVRSHKGVVHLDAEGIANIDRSKGRGADSSHIMGDTEEQHHGTVFRQLSHAAGFARDWVRSPGSCP